MTSGGRTRDRPGHIPAELTSFIGRRQDVVEVKRLLSSARLVTLTGVGGSGKTRLAIRIARELRRAFADGVWLVDLTPVTDGAMVGYTIAQALGIDIHTDEPLTEVVVRYLRDRELLLVLDNCEHLLDACATFVDSALRVAPGLRVVCTSRQVLGMVAEHVWGVAPLAVPDPRCTPPLGTEHRYPGLVLFTERAEAVVPGFVIGPDNQRTVLEICQQLDGLPLAIELAAAQLHRLSVAQLATGLREHFQLLEARYAVPARHRRLESTFDWSFALCSPREQVLWTRLSVFADTFELAAAHHVLGEGTAEETLELLAGLVDKSVLSREESPAGVRYRLLETIRRYGLCRLRALGPDGVEDRLRDRHRDWYLDLAEQFDADWYGPCQRMWIDRIRAEHGNIRAALDHSLGAGGNPRAALRLAAALRYYWYGCGALHEGRYWLHRALPLAPAADRIRLRGLDAYTMVVEGQLDHHTAARSAEDLHTLADQLAEPGFAARAELWLGVARMLGGDLASAAPLLESAVTRLAEVGEVGVLPVAIGSRAVVLLFQGDHEGAERLCEQARQLCEAHGDRLALGTILVISAMVATAAGDLTSAAEYAGRSLGLRRDLGDTQGIASTLERLAWLTSVTGDHERAARLLGAAREAWRTVGFTQYETTLRIRGHDECEAQCRAVLGESRFAVALAQGAALSRGEAIRYALGEAGPPPVPAENADEERTATALTPRERQVAGLIAEGLSNHQIASRLVTSQRTAESHVQNILRKLGFTSRTQIATWVARHLPE